MSEFGIYSDFFFNVKKVINVHINVDINVTHSERKSSMQSDKNM